MHSAVKVEPYGLGGWLILPALGVLLSVGRLLLSLLNEHLPLYRDGGWRALTTPGLDTYVPWLGPIIIFETLFNSAFLVAAVFLMVLFFRHSKLFPVAYTWIAVAGLAYILVDAFSLWLVLPGASLTDPEISQQVARAFVSVFIWVPYMHLSQRVKNTFTR